MRGRAIVLAYHDIVPPGNHGPGDASLHLSQEAFARQLDALVATHDIVPLATLLGHPPLASARPRAAITFDDAYLGALTAGVDELVARGLPATIFVAPGLLGLEPWWDLLADAKTGVVPDDRRSHALEALRGDYGAVTAWALQARIIDPGWSTGYRIGVESELRAAIGRPGITLGSHTWSHRNLQTLTASEVADELSRSLIWLRERFEIEVCALAYPYGLYTSEVERAARQASYIAAFRVNGGWIGRTSYDTPFALPRYNVPAGLSVNGLRLRLAGLGAAL